MSQDKVTVILRIHRRGFETDIELPLNISANELVIALNSAYNLNIDTAYASNCFIRAENPIALLKGNKLLCEFGIRNGSVLNFTE